MRNSQPVQLAFDLGPIETSALSIAWAKAKPHPLALEIGPLPAPSPGMLARLHRAVPSITRAAPAPPQRLARDFLVLENSGSIQRYSSDRPRRIRPGNRRLWAAHEKEMAGSFLAPETFRDTSTLYRALEAREAAITGDRKGVEAFTRSLGLWQGWVEPMSDALLLFWADPIFGEGSTLDASALKVLVDDAHCAHRNWRPLWDRKAKRQRLAMLDEPVGHGLSMYDFVRGCLPDPQDTVLRNEPEDPRVLAVLAALRPMERAVVLAWVHADVRSWRGAAVRAGALNPEAAGRAVRKRVRRLAERLKDGASLPAGIGGWQ